MSSPPRERDSITPDDALPPVEAPTAGFILQLFVAPAVIVLIIVLVWLLFNWLAHMGGDPQKYVDMLSRNNAARWQAASTLADQLRQQGEKAEALKNDRVTAGKLAKLLDEQVEAGNELRSESDIKLRVYLCKALGEFEVPAGADALKRAATTQRYEDELMVRRAAIEGLALLADNNRDSAAILQPELTDVLLECSRDQEPGIRLAAAYALGVVGDEQATERLQVLVDDPYPSVRFNAATGLARNGHEAAVPVLVEMLDAEETPGLDTESGELARTAKQFAVRSNALRAAVQLHQASPEVDVQPLCDAIDRLLEVGDVEGRIRVEAVGAKRELEAVPAAVGQES